MDPETIQQAWDWLLSLSKIQLISLGVGVAVLVAISKVMRFVFLVVVVLAFLLMFVPQLKQRYEQSPLPGVVNGLVREGERTTPHPPDPQPEAAGADRSTQSD